MGSAKRKTRADSRAKAPPSQPATAPDELDAASRALVEAEGARLDRRPEVAPEESVQAPLADRPEVEAEEDRWLLERSAEGVEDAGD